MRTPLLPTDVPASRTRAQRFDQAVLEAIADLEDRWPGRLDAIEFAVDEVPLVPAEGSVLPSDEVVLDGGVPLTRFLPPGIDAKGRPTKARIVVYRRPLEVRSSDAGDLMNRYGVLQTGVTVLPKPFTSDEVLTGIRAIIDVLAS